MPSIALAAQWSSVAKRTDNGPPHRNVLGASPSRNQDPKFDTLGTVGYWGLAIVAGLGGARSGERSAKPGCLLRPASLQRLDATEATT